MRHHFVKETIATTLPSRRSAGGQVLSPVLGTRHQPGSAEDNNFMLLPEPNQLSTEFVSIGEAAAVRVAIAPQRGGQALLEPR